MKRNKIYLFAFGVGVGVVKSIADYFSRRENLENLIIVTGSKSESEIMYRDYFDNLKSNSKKISITHVVSRPEDDSYNPRGYIQEHLDEFDFNNADIYVCGQEKACLELVEKVKSKNPENCDFFIEGFH